MPTAIHHVRAVKKFAQLSNFPFPNFGANVSVALGKYYFPKSSQCANDVKQSRTILALSLVCSAVGSAAVDVMLVSDTERVIHGVTVRRVRFSRICAHIHPDVYSCVYMEADGFQIVSFIYRPKHFLNILSESGKKSIEY